MKKKTVREKIDQLPDVTDWIKGEEKRDRSFKTSMDRLRIRIAIVKAIKAIRQKANITQAELAKALNVHQSTIGRLESMKDNRLPNIDLLIKISQITRKRIKIHEKDFDLELVGK